MIHVSLDGIIFNTQPPGGISRIFIETIPFILADGQDIKFSLYMPVNRQRCLPDTEHTRFYPMIPTHVFGSSHIWYRGSGRINRLIQKLTCPYHTIWHTTYFTPPPRSVKAYLVTFYDVIFEYAHHYTKKHNLHERAVKEADFIITISESVRDDVMAVYGMEASKIRAIPLACSSLFRKLDDAGNSRLVDRPFLLYVGGRGDAHKNFLRLLDAFSRWKHRTETKLVVVGPPWNAAERSLLDSLKIADAVVFYTNAGDNLLCRLYNEALALVYPSRYEGFGIPLLEAMACECPVIASDIPTSREVAGEYPIYFQPESTDDLCDAMDIAYSRNGITKKQKMIGAAKREQYSWRKTAQETLRVYGELA